jgi:hypothetical protein
MTENFIISIIYIALIWFVVTCVGGIYERMGEIRERIARLEVKVNYLEKK